MTGAAMANQKAIVVDVNPTGNKIIVVNQDLKLVKVINTKFDLSKLGDGAVITFDTTNPKTGFNLMTGVIAPGTNTGTSTGSK